MSMQTNLGQRLHNPLNIRYNSRNRWLGLDARNPQSKGFCRFTNDDYGLRAAIVLLKNYITLHGCDTPRKIVNRWAPPSENNTAIYLACVCGRSLIKPDKHLSTGSMDLAYLVSAMARQETGMVFFPAYVQSLREQFKV